MPLAMARPPRAGAHVATLYEDERDVAGVVSDRLERQVEGDGSVRSYDIGLEPNERPGGNGGNRRAHIGR